MARAAMAVASEDEDKPASDAHSAAEEYEGDEGESYRGEEEEEDEFDEAFEFDDFEDDDEFDDEFDGDDVDGVDDADGSVDDNDDGGGSDRLLRRTRSVVRAAGPPLPQHNFAPPFYGRPPTPLPPSPSLTSLLRPSRPTTPDATDDDLEPVPRAAPQVPTYEYYGFVLYLFSSLAFLMYLLWSYLPSPFLHALGIYYYPNRWWSLALPSFLVMTLVYTYVALASYNAEILTLPLDSIETIVDQAAKLAAVDEHGHVVVVGGPDGSQVQGRGVTAASASENSTTHHHSSSSRSQSQQQQQQQQHHDHHNPSLHNADTIASWSSKPFHHQREPSSPSPPLGKAAWRDRSAKSNRDRKSKKSTAGGADASGTGAGSGSTAQAGEDGGLTMGGRGRGWSGRSDSHELGHDGNSYSSGHRSSHDWNQLWNVGTDAVMDIPLAGVCEVLYG